MAERVNVYLDSSALFAGIWSSAGGGRMILKLGEAGAIQLLIGSQVLSEVENALRNKAPSLLGLLTLLLEKSEVRVVPPPNQSTVHLVQRFVERPGDVQVCAAAVESGALFFVTLDQQHFLNNQLLRENLPIQIGTPGDFLSWFRTHLP